MIKKILWICNIPLPEIQDMVGVKSYNEGWLIGISNQLRNLKDIELHYAFPQHLYPKILNRRINGINFWGFYDTHRTSYEIKRSNISIFSKLVKKIEPDVIHIFGTEYSHALEFANSISDKNKIVVSIQGLTSEIAKVYLKGIPFIQQIQGRFSDGEYRCLINDRMNYFKRGANERRLLLNVKHVIGRTKWDKKCVKKINPKCYYYYCSETLRDIFYKDTWDIKNIQRHSIFINQGNYPIKGLHLFICALPLIKQKFPDVLVYVAGDKNFLSSGDAYGIYIKKLIKKYNLDNNFIFLGKLTDNKIKEKLLESNVLLMPSLIENSPNSIGEAMLVGTPVVASNVGGIPSILKHGVEGYLYPVMDRGKLSEFIIKVFEDDSLALYFSKNGRRRAKLQYSRENNINQLLKIYEQIINI